MNTIPVSGVVCPCEGTPHPEGDTVELRETLGLAAGVALQRLLIGSDSPQAEIVGALMEGYLRFGVVAWTFVDDIGKPVPVTPETIQSMLLDNFTRAYPVAEAADSLYEGPVFGPLATAAANSSRTTTTAASTSRRGSGSRRNGKPSKPSLTSITQTDDTVTTSA